MNTKVPKSPREQIRGICYFPRMCEKIRMKENGELRADLHENLGKGFDKRCVDFLQVSYDDIIRLVKEGKSDAQILDWCFAQKFHPSEEQIEIWSAFMSKRGWKDEGSEVLKRRIKEGGFENRTDIETMFDYIDLDEGRDPAKR